MYVFIATNQQRLRRGIYTTFSSQSIHYIDPFDTLDKTWKLLLLNRQQQSIIERQSRTRASAHHKRFVIAELSRGERRGV